MELEIVDNSTLVKLGKRVYHMKKAFEIKKDVFTRRETEIIRHMADGLTSDEISAELYISKNTVDTHRKNIYRKGNFRSIRDVVLFSLFL